jgi:hypothetical protein
MPTSDQIAGVIRTLLTAAVAWAMGKGYIDNQTGAAAVTFGVTVGVAAWAAYSTRQTAMIQSVNANLNGVKVVAATSPSPPVDGPISVSPAK